MRRTPLSRLDSRIYAYSCNGGCLILGSRNPGFGSVSMASTRELPVLAKHVPAKSGGTFVKT